MQEDVLKAQKKMSSERGNQREGGQGSGVVTVVEGVQVGAVDTVKGGEALGLKS